MAKMRVFTVAYVPEGLEQKWLQHLRSFDAANPDCHFEVVADVPDKKIAEVLELLRVQPAFSFAEVIRRYEPGQGKAPSDDTCSGS